MSDEHLANAIDYVTKQYGHTAAVIAMTSEQWSRKNAAGGSGYLSPNPNPLITATTPMWSAPWDTTTALGLSAMKGNFGDMGTGTKDYLFEVAILRDEESDGGKVTTTLVYGPDTYVAATTEQAKLAAVADFSREYPEASVRDIRVIVRNFGG
jgi:hypothetical protein